MADINFYAGPGATGYGLAGSGIGFYGAGGFGFAVQVGEYQGTTFITNGNGTANGPAIDNVKYTHPFSGLVNASGSETHLKGIPNYLATLNVRVTNTTAISTQNARVYCYDRVSINNAQSGVALKVAELVHPWTAILPSGSGSSSWVTPVSTGVYLSLTNSPGLSGINAMAGAAATQHDWYLAMSASPTSIGSKTSFGMYFSVEYT